MKKIFLLMTIMTSFFFALSIDSNASSYNDPISGLNLDLDTGVPLLGGFTLEEVFFDYNLLNSENFLDNNNDGLYNAFQLPSQYNINTSYNIYNDTQYFYNPDYSNQFASSLRTKTINELNDTSKVFYISYYSENVTALVIKAEFARDYENNGGALFGLGNGRQSYLIQSFGNIVGNDFISFYRTTSQDQLILRNFTLLDINALGITATRYQIDYYYNLYVSLKAGFSPEIFYIQGSAVGYGNGYDDGYDSGLLDGYDNGYSDGQEDGYDTGYLDGNVDGLETGYLNGYNDGFDEGVVSEVDTQWLLGFVTGTVNVLGVSVVPGISLGVFVFIPLFLGFIGFIFRLGGRRG